MNITLLSLHEVNSHDSAKIYKNNGLNLYLKYRIYLHNNKL